MTRPAWNDLIWKPDRLPEAFETLARRSGFAPRQPESGFHPPVDGDNPETLANWVGFVCQSLGIEAEALQTTHAELSATLRRAAPAVLRVTGSEPGFIALAGGGKSPALLAPDLKLYRLPLEEIRARLCFSLEEPFVARARTLVEEAGVSPERRPRCVNALVAEQLRQANIGGGWLLRPAPHSAFTRHAQTARLFRPLLFFFLLQILLQGLMLAGWWLIGRNVLEGSAQPTQLGAWALLTFTAIPFQVLALWLQNRFVTGWGAIFKQRLLYGTLRLHPDETRSEGRGHFLERVMAADAVEMLSINGGMLALNALVSILSATVVMVNGAGGWLQAILFVLFCLAGLALAWFHYTGSRNWRSAFRSMTNDMVERMVGYRTRLAQEDPGRWHEQEDISLEHYLDQSLRLDRREVPLRTLNGLWVAAGVAVLALPLAGGRLSGGALAVALGGILLGSSALNGLINGAFGLGALLLSWQQVGPVLKAAGREEPPPRILLTAPSEVNANSGVVLAGRGLNFRYRPFSRLALDQVNISIHSGERILIEGPSGGGKSTLAAVLAGLRTPESGLLLLRGYDRQSLGDGAWCQKVVIAPQFHENHVFSESLAFNLLMGRAYPPRPEDLRAAEEICRELGLWQVIEHMPSGMQQMLGESGWQLSHGEQSRLFIARALLQHAEVLILDESFGALDPENMERALRCVLRRAPALVVIAHP